MKKDRRGINTASKPSGDSPQGAVIAQFSIASSERWKDKNGELQERTEWFAVKAFGRRAEIAGEYLHKGSRVYLEGRKRTESWDDKKTGSKNYRDLVYADRIEFLDSRSNGNGESMPDESAEEHNTSSEECPLLSDINRNYLAEA